jgi:hypothetical protein
MKKIGLLSLALILALGALGVGYATWTDTVSVTGTVYTGTVEVGILDTGTNDPGPGQYFMDDSQADFSADPRVEPQDPWNSAPVFVTPDKDTASCNSYNLEPVKCTLDSGVAYYQTVYERIDHAYPFYAPTMYLQIASCGCVPVKIDDVAITGTYGYWADVSPCIIWAWTIDPPEDGVATVSGWGTLDDLIAALDHFQIEENEVLYLDLTEIFLECTPQGVYAGFDLTFTASQWNEVSD